MQKTRDGQLWEATSFFSLGLPRRRSHYQILTCPVQWSLPTTLFKADPAPAGVSRIFSLSGKLSGNGFHPQPRLAAHGLVWSVFSCYCHAIE